MYHIIVFLLVIISCNMQGFSQDYPNYQFIIPEVVSMNHACNSETMNTEAYQDDNNTFFKDVISDSQGNLYFWGVSPYQLSSTENFNITFGDNSSSPLSFARMSSSGNNIYATNEYKYFIAKYNSNGVPQWISFMTDSPKKMLLDESENRLYVIYHQVRQIDGISYPTDSIMGSEYKIMMLYDMQTGQVVNYFNRKYIYDFHFIGNKKIVVSLISYTTTYHQVRFGFYENNQIVKWQSEYGNIKNMADLYYHPYQQAFWYFQGNNYYRILLHPLQDSLIIENISRPLYLEPMPPYMNLSKIEKIHFMPDGNYLAEYYGNSTNTSLVLAKVDTLGNLLWKIKYKPDRPNLGNWDDIYEYAIDQEGNIWTDISRAYYDSYLEFVSSGQSYYVNEKQLELSDALWKIDGNTGTLIQAYHKGWGCYTGEGGKAIHITSQNNLIVTMHNRGIVYIPHEYGFTPFYENCNGLQQSSPFMWLSYDLGNMHVTSVEDYFDFIIENNFKLYPNPSSGTFILQTEHGGEFELLDIHGRMIQVFKLQNTTEQIQVNLPNGMYFIREKESGATQKVIIE